MVVVKGVVVVDVDVEVLVVVLVVVVVYPTGYQTGLPLASK